MIVDGSNIVSIRHPDWSSMKKSWAKWRIVYRGGDDFNEAYLKKFSNLEDNTDFIARKEITPSPSFAKTTINEVKNSIFQRMGEISRKDGPKSYQVGVSGQGFGVDLHGTDMNTFMGTKVLPELLTMAKIGIWVDMPPVTGPSMVDAQGKTPYLYVYKAEEILSWSYRKDRIQEFQSVLLCDYVDDCDTSTGLPNGTWKRHRLCWIDENGTVWCRMFDEEGIQIDLEGKPTQDDFKIDLPYIPFMTLELNDSLLSDVANHQIGLLNMESCDIAYALKSNFPILVEQFDERQYSEYLKVAAGAGGDGTEAGTVLRDERNIKTGPSVGRRYGQGMEAPSFISPSPDPITVSMAKQAQLKEDIRSLINLSLSSIKPKMASAESKALDQQGLESGLAYIGLELQRGERAIAKIWADYEAEKTPATISYPTKWGIESDEDRRKAVEQLEDLRDTVPSPTFQKLISGKMVKRLIGDEISVELRDQIDSEIKAAKTITADPDTIFKAVEDGILDLELAAVILGFPKESPGKAADEHAARLARIAATQTAGPAGAANAAARGVGDQSATPKADAAAEKTASRDTTQQATPTDNTRGQGQ